MLLVQSPLPEDWLRIYAGRGYEAYKLRLLKNVAVAYDGCDGRWKDLAPRITEREAVAEAHETGLGMLTEDAAFRGVDSLFRTRARLRITRAALALERYRARHGRLPETLRDLEAKDHDLERQDPFDGQPIRYLHDEQGYLLYSVGHNLKDDGGVHYRKRTEQLERGDIVFTVHPAPEELREGASARE